MDCKLYPHKKKEITSIQEIKQTMGWQISAFDLPKAWTYSEGQGVTIGVLDTGCDLEHPDLQGNVLEGYNVLNPDKKPIDRNDHGTHITGSICALNNDLGIIGVAPQSKVVPIKVLDDHGLGELKNVAKGIMYGIERKVDMMCLSLGSVKPVASLRKSIKKAYELGIPVFCAGGNIRKEMDALYPARYPETIAISALDKNFRRADFSNTSRQNIDFLAPGVDILSTVKDGWYATFSGSSTAVPFAVGVAALLLSAKRNKDIKIKLAGPEDYRLAFRDHGTELDKYDGDKLFAGYGIIEPDKLVEWIQKQ
jgi:subtilisin family serine protease